MCIRDSLYGVAAMLVAAMLVLRRSSDDRARDPLTNLTIRVDLDAPICAHEIVRDLSLIHIYGSAT